MSYVIDRARAFRDGEVVAALGIKQRGMRSRLVLRDGRLVDTRTRVRTFRRKLEQRHGQAFTQII